METLLGNADSKNMEPFVGTHYGSFSYIWKYSHIIINGSITIHCLSFHFTHFTACYFIAVLFGMVYSAASDPRMIKTLASVEGSSAGRPESDWASRNSAMVVAPSA